jgi:hypothetical protein
MFFLAYIAHIIGDIPCYAGNELGIWPAGLDSFFHRPYIMPPRWLGAMRFIDLQAFLKISNWPA